MQLHAANGVRPAARVLVLMWCVPVRQQKPWTQSHSCCSTTSMLPMESVQLHACCGG